MNRTRNQRRGFGRFIRSGLGQALRLIRAADGAEHLSRWLADITAPAPTPAPPPQHLPLKHERLNDLLQEGFNCADFRSWPRGELDVPELKEFFQKHGRISLRNFREEIPGEPTPKLPVAYDQADWDRVSSFCREYNRQYHTLVNEAFPVEQSLYAGNVILIDDQLYVVSSFEGYGTPRDVDDQPASSLKVFKRTFGEPAPAHMPAGLRDIGERFRTFLPDRRPMTIEFSVYPYPVGLLQRPEIFWEWRGGSTQDLYTVIARLLDRVEAHDLTPRLPPLAPKRR